MSRVERVERLLRQIKDETRVAFDEHTQLYHRTQSLESENAKLRELVQGLWFAAQYLGMNPDGATGSGFVRQMRELGIEVEDV